MVAELTTATGWTRPEKLAVKRLYLTQGLSPKEIADKLGKDNRSVVNLVSRNGWARLRREAEDKAHEEATVSALDVAREFNENVANRSELLVEAGFDLAESAAAGKDAKEFAFAASGTAKFVSLTRQALGMDAQALISVATLNLIVGQPLPDEPKRVQKVNTDSEALEFD